MWLSHLKKIKSVICGTRQIDQRFAPLKTRPKLLSCKYFRFLGHRHNLANSDCICAHKDVIGKLKKVICKHCFPVRHAKLHKFTDLAPETPEKSNDTQRSSMNAFLTCFFEISSFLSDPDITEIGKRYPHTAKAVALTSLCFR